MKLKLKPLMCSLLVMCLVFQLPFIEGVTASADKSYVEKPDGLSLISSGSSVYAYNGMVFNDPAQGNMDGAKEHLTDGNLATFSGGLGGLDFYIDLGQKMPLEYVEIHFKRLWNGMNKVYVSDDAKIWTEVVSGDGSVHEYLQDTAATDIMTPNVLGALLPVDTAGQYVRFTTSAGYVDLFEIQVYSSESVGKVYTDKPDGLNLVSQGMAVTGYNGMQFNDGTPNNLTDGNQSTMAGGYGAVDFYIDLGRNIPLEYVKILFNRLWDGTNKVYVSNDSANWTEIVSGDGAANEYLKDTSATDSMTQPNEFGALLPANTSGRYVRFTTKDWANIYEVQVYSSKKLDASHIKITGPVNGKLLTGFSMQMNAEVQYGLKTPPGSPGDSNIKYFGRWDKSNSTDFSTGYWSGAYLKVDFTGTTIKAVLGNTPTEFQVKIDDGNFVDFTAVPGATIDLTPTPLSEGVHSMLLVPKGDGQRNFQFRGFLLEDGATTQIPSISPSIIEFAGDSITVGYGASDYPIKSYPWLVAERIGAEHTQIAHGGISLPGGYRNTINTTGLGTAFFKSQNIEVQSSAPWDFNTYTPRTVVVNIGTNDAMAGVPDSEFQCSYVTLLSNIRAQYPSASIYAIRPFGGQKEQFVSSAVDARIAAGDPDVHYVDTTGWLNSEDYLDGIHPNDSGIQKIVDLLSPIIGSALLSQDESAASFGVKTRDGISVAASGGNVSAENTSVTWSVYAPSGSTGEASIDKGTGLLTAIAPGIVTVQAAALDGSGVVGTTDVHISSAAEIWRTMEFTLTSSNTYNNPFMDVEVTATFTGPGGEVLTRPAFWDGGNAWKVRFAPTAVGNWTVTTQATDETDTGLNVSAPIAFESVPYGGALDIYKKGFIQTVPGEHHFSYQDGTPFFYLGDTHWFMPAEDFEASNVEGIDSQFKYGVDHRASQGYTVYQSEPLNMTSIGMDVTQGIREGDLAFLHNIDRKFQYVADAGLVHANASYTFTPVLNVTDHELLKKLGRYWQARYGAYPVLWTVAQESDPNFYGEIDPQYWQTLAEALHDSDAYNHPLSAHMQTLLTPVTAWGDKDYHSWFAGQTVVTTKDVFEYYWNYPITKPFVSYETGYEFNNRSSDDARAAAYRAFGNGSFGYGYGVQGIWALNNSPDSWFRYGPYYRWFDGLNAPAGSQMTHFKNFYSSLAWWKLTPTFNDTTYAELDDGPNSYVTTDGNKTYVAYFTSYSKKTGILKNMADTVYKAQWFNTRTGEYTLISDQITPVNGQWSMPERSDRKDWVLLATSGESALVSNLVVSSEGNATTIFTQDGTLQMSAAIADANIEDVTWEVKNMDGTATDLAAIDEHGLLTAMNNGIVRVVASTANDGRKASKTVIIVRQDNPNPPAKAQSLTIKRDGVSNQLLPYFQPRNTLDQRVSWEVYESDGQTPTNKAHISEYGVVTPIDEGTVRVIATALDGSGLKASYDFTIPPFNDVITNPLLTGATVTASTTDYGNGYRPAKAITSQHGDWAGWASDTIMGLTSYANPQWLQVDFAQPTTFNHVEVYSTGSGPNGFQMRDYDIQYWNGNEWVTIYSVKDNLLSSATVLTDDITTSKIRVICYLGDRLGITRISSIEVYRDAQSHDARLSGISIGGEALSGFDPGITSYNVVLPTGTTASPTVTAATMNGGAQVSIAQAPSLPGKAVITVTAEDGTTVAEYKINFTVATTPDPGQQTTPTSTPEQSAIIKVKAVADESGTAAIRIDSATFGNAVSHAANGEVTIEVSGAEAAKQITVVIPVKQLKAGLLTGVNTVVVDIGSVKLIFAVDSLLVGTQSESDSGDLEVSVSKVDVSTLPEQVKRRLGDRAVYDFSLQLDGKTVDQFKTKSVKVAIDYALKPGENPHQVVVYFINDSGKLEIVKNGKYNTATGQVVFSPKHFSKYGAMSNEVIFRDAVSVSWAKISIEALAAREMLAGNGNQQFKPNDQVTRAEFLKMLMEALDLVDGGKKLTFSDVTEGAWYYNSLASAHKLGIAKGKSDGSFGCIDPITRQDMAVISYRALQALKHEASGNSNAAPFSDGSEISPYASEAVQAIQKLGLIEGQGNGKFAPKSQASRAQAAVMVHRLFTYLY